MKNIAIVTPNKKTSYSETFIKVHLEQLPARIHHLYGISNRGYPPIYAHDGSPFFSDNILFNYIEAGIDRLFGESGIGYYLRNRKLQSYLLEQNIEIVLAEYGPTGTFVMNVCDRLQIPLVVYFYGRDSYHHMTIQRFGKRYQKMFNIAKLVFTVSEDMRQQLIRLGLDANKAILNPCPPQQGYFSFTKKAVSPPVFLAVGRFTSKKSPDLTLRAFQLVAKENPDARLIMIGDGPLFAQCIQLASYLQIADKVEFPGPKSPKELAEYYSSSRAFVQHSVVAEDGDSEGTPVAILEAMACGLPVVSTLHGGIKDVVLEGETGYLVDEGDYLSMAERMSRLAADETLASRLGQRGAERINKRYTIQKHLDDLWQPMLELIEEFG